MTDTPTLFVTGATGQLGGLVVDALLGRVPPAAIVAGARDPNGDGAAALRAKGVEVREADYTRPETLATAFAGVKRLLLISSSENGRSRSSDPIAVVQRCLSLSRKRTLVHLGRYDQGANDGVTPAGRVFPHADNPTQTSDTLNFAENRGSRVGVTTGRGC